MFSTMEVSLLRCQTRQKMTQESLLVSWRKDKSPSCHVQGAAPAANKCHWNKRQKETCTQRILEHTTRIRSRITQETTCASFLRTFYRQWRNESLSNSHLGEGCPYASVTLHLLPVRGRAFQTSLSTRHEPRLLFCQKKEGAGKAAWPCSRSRTVSARAAPCQPDVRGAGGSAGGRELKRGGEIEKIGGCSAPWKSERLISISVCFAGLFALKNITYLVLTPIAKVT